MVLPLGLSLAVTPLQANFLSAGTAVDGEFGRGGAGAFFGDIAFSADGSRLASGSLDDSVRLWDAVSGEPVAVLAGHHDNVYAVAFIPDGTRLASGSNDNTIRLWDIASHEQVALIKGHEDYVYALAFSPDGSWLVSGSGDHTARIWDTLPVHQRWRARVRHRVGEQP